MNKKLYMNSFENEQHQKERRKIEALNHRNIETLQAPVIEKGRVAQGCGGGVESWIDAGERHEHCAVSRRAAGHFEIVPVGSVVKVLHGHAHEREGVGRDDGGKASQEIARLDLPPSVPHALEGREILEEHRREGVRLYLQEARGELAQPRKKRLAHVAQRSQVDDVTLRKRRVHAPPFVQLLPKRRKTLPRRKLRQERT